MLLDQLASHPGNFGSIQELMDITLELDTRDHERQKEESSHQEKKPPVTGLNSFRPPQDSSSKTPHHKKNEVFKEIKDSGEDVSGSTLHVFQGDMKFPPSPFHASLKEKWDEEKEPEYIEAVLKVVPPA
ncbi:hypothetical protein O181_027327 [Austropuccinia psidii MF-1]|uniref:Uncharacterized protein n=1 Tax=Austropuccinia psidii MF-1 TaxID=1389203 RepID=A0A9Q3CPV0_9BASI|nr:hypothetical protein [Austropuccinia psidii MF-1]